MGMSSFSRCNNDHKDQAKNQVVNNINYNTSNTVINNNLPNPNPSNYHIMDHAEANGHLLLCVYYPDCTNYEGMKILLYLNRKYSEILGLKKIDPHFCDKCFSPFARFEPTMKGWNAGLKMMKLIFKEEDK